jgi:tryptophanyl-tRNA synthetase
MGRIFSGVQPTGNLHLGNYLGAIRNFVTLQQDYDCIYCVVDLHAVTLWQDPAELTHNTREVTAAYLAAGVHPEGCIIFNQSQVSAHAELAWVLNCVARLGWLNRMTQFKEKAGKHKENASVGLYAYPNLMAADILAYKATHVPVGMSLRDGRNKMSKSDPSDMSRINMTDEADAIAKKIRKARTDPEPLPGPEVLDDEGRVPADAEQARPEAYNLLGIYAALANRPLSEVLAEFEGAQFSQFKEVLTDLAVTVLGPIGSEMKRLTGDAAHVDGVLRRGAERAREITRPILEDVHDIVGFLRP